MIRVLTLLLIFTGLNLSFSQEKNEFERRIKPDEVHENAKKWLKNTYQKGRKTKWYYQTDGQKEVFEAKLKHQNHLHSVEFNLAGTVQNIEILIDQSEVDKEVLKAIMSFLDASYMPYLYSKLQIQYTGDKDDLEKLISKHEPKDLEVNYEIEFYGKSNSDDELWEALFDDKGNFVQKRIINLKATDNLDY